MVPFKDGYDTNMSNFILCLLVQCNHSGSKAWWLVFFFCYSLPYLNSLYDVGRVDCCLLHMFINSSLASPGSCRKTRGDCSKKGAVQVSYIRRLVTFKERKMLLSNRGEGSACTCSLIPLWTGQYFPGLHVSTHLDFDFRGFIGFILLSCFSVPLSSSE